MSFSNKFRVLLVGGAVRDKLLGIEPKDRDWVIVGATEDDVNQLLAKGFSRVGADFPVFLHPETNEEYALARVERKIGAGYHGFTTVANADVTIEDDLARRDLTINSMAMDEDGKLIDPYSGLSDLHNHVLRHTTSAFIEDPLRVLRLARFAARFNNFKVAPETIALCRLIATSGELNDLSNERIWTELEKGFNENCILDFMTVLHDTYALDRCDLLHTLFGAYFTPEQKNKCKVLKNIDGTSKLSVCVAVLGAKINEVKNVHGATKRIVDACNSIDVLCNTDRTAHSLNALLKNIGALRDHTVFEDAIKIALVLEAVKEINLKFSVKELLIGTIVVKEVKAIQFPGVEGRALGNAIENQRINNLQAAMGIPKE
jgi:tRNA nucleotidyltransferase (CCA-adding enzyme)